MSFGRTTRYIQCFRAADAAQSQKVQAWDEAVRSASAEYSGRMHNLVWDNCHSHVGFALDMIKFRGFGRWNMVFLAVWMFFAGTFVSFGRFLQSVMPSVVLYAVVCLLVFAV